MASTVNCILCSEKAICFTGHVHNGKEIITAGFCKNHRKTKSTIHGCKGCHGKWDEKMGKDNSFMQLMYIDANGQHPVEVES